LRLKTRLYYDDYENTLDTYDDNTYSTQNRQGPPSGTSIYDDYSFGLNFQTFWNGLSHNSLALGFSMKKDVHEENFQNSPFDKFVSYTYCVALEDTILLQENLTLTLGGSYDIFDKHERSQVGLLSNDPGNDIKTFSPQVGLSYDPTDAFNIYGSFGRKVRFPTMRNLYATGVIGPQGDPNLKEERTHNYELGCSWLITNQVRLDAALFYSDIENLIHFDNLIGRFEQYEDASIAGVEFNMTGQVMDELTASIGYTFLRAENDSLVTIQNNFHNDLVYKPDELPYRPEHKVDFDLCRNFDFGMKINLNGSYISKQRYYDHADPNNNQILTATKKWLDDYVLLNIKIAQAITENIQVFITAENVLDEEYESIHLFPGKGSAFWIGAKIGL
jgi:outer membrane receptor protein involved in Fe transport